MWIISVFGLVRVLLRVSEELLCVCVGLGHGAV